MKVKALLLVPVPPGAVTVIVPVAPLPTVAVSEVSLTTVKATAAVLPKTTALAPVKLIPVMLTIAPAPPLVGVNDVMAGAVMKVNVPVLVAIPPGVVTVIVPDAPLPTVTVSEVSLRTV